MPPSTLGDNEGFEDGRRQGVRDERARIENLAKEVPPVWHRPSRLDAEHTACGERIDRNTHLQLGDGETCERCTHVVAQVAAAVRGEPSWAQKS
jgi:hypothetical protein